MVRTERPRRRLPIMRSVGIRASAWITIGVGVMGSAAPFLILGQIQSAAHTSHTGWYVVAIGLLILGSTVVAIGVVEAIRQVKEARLSPLEIEHDPTDDQCAQSRFGNPTDVQLRIKVRNTSRIDLNRVRARLRREGGGEHWLRIRHDNTAPFNRSLEGETLPADPSYWVYFDVAYSADGIGWDGFVFLEYADDYLKNHTKSRLAKQMLTIKVWASREDDGKSVLPVEKHFELELLDRGPGIRLTEPSQ